jgi:hypothetical protein
LLEFLDILEEPFNPIPSLFDLIIKLRVHLVPSVDLGLEVLDCTIDIAERALLSSVLALLLFEIGFQL